MPFINRLSVNAVLRFSSSHLYFLVQIPDKPFNIFFVSTQNENVTYLQNDYVTPQNSV
jgi:hypothetical protein